MTTTLFDTDHDTDRPDPEQRRAVRRLALGGILQQIRARNVWSVNDAASHASIAPMTWRRMEDGLDVRQRTHVAVDRLLDLPFGTVKRALSDDRAMVELVMAHGGAVIDARNAHDAAGLLDEFAERTLTGSPRQAREGSLTQKWTLGPQATTQHIEQALAALSQHTPANHPTNLELATQLVERLAALPPTTAIDSAVHAILKAMPDLIARTCADAEQDIADAASPE